MHLPNRRVRLFSLHFLSLAAVLGCDWFIDTGNRMTQYEAVTAWLVTGCVTAGLLTALAEHQLARASWRVATFKGALALALVAAPSPVLGSLLAMGALAGGIATAITHAVAESRSTDRAR